MSGHAGFLVCIAGLYVPALLRRCWKRNDPGRAEKLGAAGESSRLNPSASTALEDEAVAGVAPETGANSQHKASGVAALKSVAVKAEEHMASEAAGLKGAALGGKHVSDPTAGGSGALLLDSEWDLDLMSEADAGAALGQPGHLGLKWDSESNLKLKAKG